MEFTYYLPEIIFGILAVVALVWIVRFVWAICLGKMGQATCIHCKGITQKETGESYLFVIPVHFGDTYGEAEEYLRTHMIPIESKEQIPTGMRACRLDVYRCNKCDKKQVEITDFLNVRGEESVKATYEFSYDTFRPLIEQWKELSWSSQTGRKAGGQIHGEAATIIKRKGAL